MLGVRVVPAVQLSPIDGLVEAIEGNLVLRGEEASLSILQSGLVGELFPSPVMEEAEQTQTGDEQGDDGDNSSKDCKSSPDKNKDPGCHFAKPLLMSNHFRMHPDTAQDTPRYGEAKNCVWIKTKYFLVENRGEPPGCGCLCPGEQEDQHLDNHLQNHFKA